MNRLNDYVRGMLDKAETFKRTSSDDDVQKYYAGKIVAYRNVIKQLQTEQLTIPDVSIMLPNEVKEMLVESEYRLQQAIDIFNGSSGLKTTKEDKYLKMVDCVNKINEYLKGN